MNSHWRELLEAEQPKKSRRRRKKTRAGLEERPDSNWARTAGTWAASRRRLKDGSSAAGGRAAHADNGRRQPAAEGSKWCGLIPATAFIKAGNGWKRGTRSSPAGRTPLDSRVGRIFDPRAGRVSVAVCLFAVDGLAFESTHGVIDNGATTPERKYGARWLSGAPCIRRNSTR